MFLPEPDRFQLKKIPFPARKSLEQRDVRFDGDWSSGVVFLRSVPLHLPSPVFFPKVHGRFPRTTRISPPSLSSKFFTPKLHLR